MIYSNVFSCLVLDITNCIIIDITSSTELYNTDTWIVGQNAALILYYVIINLLLLVNQKVNLTWNLITVKYVMKIFCFYVDLTLRADVFTSSHSYIVIIMNGAH